MFCLKNLRTELWFQQNFNRTLILWLLLAMYRVLLFFNLIYLQARNVVKLG